MPSPETLAALRQAAAARRDIVRLVYVERGVEPGSEPPFADRQLVVVLEQPPTEPPPREFTHALLEALGQALRQEGGISLVVPPPVGVGAATAGGEILYDRDAA